MARGVLASRCPEGVLQSNRRAAPLAALQNRVMVKRTASIRVIFFLLVGASPALCQSEPPSVDVLQGFHFDGPTSISLEVQRREMRLRKSLPNAPSFQPPTQPEKFQRVVIETIARL